MLTSISMPLCSHLERAKQLLLRGNYDDVIPACTEAVEQGEGLEPEALLLRATMYILRCQYSLALDDLETIINSQVQNVKVRQGSSAINFKCLVLPLVNNFERLHIMATHLLLIVEGSPVNPN